MPKQREIEGAVAKLIRNISRGGLEPDTSMQIPAKPGPSRIIEDDAAKLLESLPPELRLVGLRGQFPWVLNRIAKAWPDPAKFDALIDSLLIDDRGNRQGFPFAVVNEITDLRTYYFTMVRPGTRPYKPDPMRSR